jgi:presenilin-like A22 family membrane protease
MNKVFAFLIVVFLAAQLLGIGVGIGLIHEIESGQLEQPTVLTENPDDPINAVALIVGILVFTAILLLFMKFFKGAGLFRVLEIFVLFSATVIAASAFLPELAFMFAVQLVALKLLFPKNIFFRNVAAIVAVAGVGALIGVSLGVVPVLIFLILLSVYDFIAVFKTKHMVRLAKGISGRNLAFTVALPSKKHQFELGTGDLVMPLVFAVSVMKTSQPLGFPGFVVPAAMVLVASFIGLLLTINYVRTRIGKALPALPPQAALMIVAWLASKAIGF